MNPVKMNPVPTSRDSDRVDRQNPESDRVDQKNPVLDRINRINLGKDHEPFSNKVNLRCSVSDRLMDIIRVETAWTEKIRIQAE